MKYIYTLLLAGLSITMMAQPVITTSWPPTPTTPSYTITDLDGDSSTLDEGAAGAGVTWDLRSIDTLQSHDLRYQTPASAPLGSSYPTATSCEMFTDSSIFNFNALIGNVFQLVGFMVPDSGRYDQSRFYDPLDDLRLPTSYMSHFIDTSSYTLYFAWRPTDSTVVSLIDTMNADAYGTLITRAGTFTDALRIHYKSFETRYNYRSGTFTINRLNYDEFIWISPSHPGILLASISHYRYSDGSREHAGTYARMVPTGIADAADATQSQWSLSPVPASSHIEVDLAPGSEQVQAISIADMMGRQVQHVPAGASLSQGHSTIDVSSLADGIYTVSLHTDGGISSRRMVISH